MQGDDYPTDDAAAGPDPADAVRLEAAVTLIRDDEPGALAQQDGIAVPEGTAAAQPGVAALAPTRPRRSASSSPSARARARTARHPPTTAPSPPIGARRRPATRTGGASRRSICTAPSTRRLKWSPPPRSSGGPPRSTHG